MMFSVKNFLYFILLHLVIASSQINLHLTDKVNDNKTDIVFQHDCLHVPASTKKENNIHEIISYCLTEWSSKWNIEENSIDRNFTFNQLYKQNITSQQLYLWSAPMDVVERYQFYLNHLSISNQSSFMATQLFYNCTLPRFGPLCQYSLDTYISHNSSLYEIIYDFYQHEYNPINLTCYTHLECNRGSSSICLDWTEICDRIIDCQNGIDEEFCGQLHFSDCEENEYQCANGQCISKIFLRDNRNTFECLDRTDEIWKDMKRNSPVFFEVHSEPTFATEDIACPQRHNQNHMKLTSSCLSKRVKILEELLFNDVPIGVSDDCWIAVKCQSGIYDRHDPRCPIHCSKRTCKEIINQTCLDMLPVPTGTIAFGHIFFIYTKEDMIKSNVQTISPSYVCYNDQLCDEFYPNKSLISFNNATCRRPADFPLQFKSFAFARGNWFIMYVLPLYQDLSHCNKIHYTESANCNNLTMYKCINSSMCISKHRLCDNIIDCKYNDDEECTQINGSCLLHGLDDLFKCTTINICISPALVKDGWCHCGFDQYDLCDDEDLNELHIRKHISFTAICDGFIELIPVTINGRNETDETECEYWQCNNTYTRCDGFWNCFNGADEVDCYSSSLSFNCPYQHHHICVSPHTNQFMCLPFGKAHDGNIDCLGGTDEPKLCRSNDYQSSDKNFQCISDTDKLCIKPEDLCYQSHCQDGTDEQFCDKNRGITLDTTICHKQYESVRSEVENFFCARQFDTNKPTVVHFSLGKSTNSTNQITQQHTNKMILHSSIRQTTIQQHQQRCHRGLPLRIWLNIDKNLPIAACLCPPSFYGNMCQYQNQRVSLTLKFQTFSDSRRTLFALIILLIDDSNERIIHSYQQLTYIYIRDCQRKFNIYLLYSTRPKNLTKNYFIHIDIYEKISFTYRKSFLIPLKYPFLPVHRIAVQLNIPYANDRKENCLNQPCIHGQCIKYSNNSNNNSFCQCYREWTGKYCTIPYRCTCSSDSLCIGISSNNRSICICPLHKWGSQCLLHNTICYSNQNATCQNNGKCIPIDENIISDKPFICICPKGFSGERCEIVDNKIILLFHKDIILPQTMFVHFIRAIDNGPHENGSTFKIILANQKSVTIQWPHPFHVAFLDFFNNNYYLIIVQNKYNSSTRIIRTITPLDHCKHISEILNETIMKLHPLRRIKYYQLPCQKRSPLLSCFYDDNHFCFCNDYDHQRLTNCFEFNHGIEHNCFGQSNCENGALCLQDKATCPQTSICVCPKCFYGARCQFTSNLFDLSLDAILGYYIQPHINIKHQPSIVQVSVALVIIIIIAGTTDSVLSIITFRNKESRKTGCGLYLLTSSIITLLIMIIFALKFWILIIAQITYMTNQSFLKFQCISIDFFLRIGLSMDQWLNACVAIERTITIIKGTRFDKNKSKQIAKYIILILLFMNTSTTIHDPIHRRLLNENDDDVDEKRIWCIVTYSSNLRAFNSFILIFHFLAPFFINIISAIIIIVMITRQRTTLQKHQSYKKLLREQFQQHKNLIIAPFVLVILAVPRLIISFVGGCMKSTSGSWLSLIGYLISFVPSMLTFLLFIFPSESYKQIFRKTIEQYRRTIRIRLHLNS